jgi:hypothetical protein
MFPTGKGRIREEGYSAVEITIAMLIIVLAISTVTRLYKIFDLSFLTISERGRVNQVTTYTMDQVSASLREVRSVAYLNSAYITPTISPTPAFTPARNEVYTGRVVHLDPAGQGYCALKLPNFTDPTDPTYDTILFYFLDQKADGTVKLYQRLRYYNGVYSPCVPAMAHINRLRVSPEGTPQVIATVFPPEPTPGGTAVPYPNMTFTPTPQFMDNIGKMPGLYQSPRITFDDVSFYYDNTNNLISFGLTAKVRSASKPFQGDVLHGKKWWETGGRKRSMTTTVNLRRTQQ